MQFWVRYSISLHYLSCFQIYNTPYQVSLVQIRSPLLLGLNSLQNISATRKIFRTIYLSMICEMMHFSSVQKGSSLKNPKGFFHVIQKSQLPLTAKSHFFRFIYKQLQEHTAVLTKNTVVKFNLKLFQGDISLTEILHDLLKLLHTYLHTKNCIRILPNFPWFFPMRLISTYIKSFAHKSFI